MKNSETISPWRSKKIMVIGAGQMGGGITQIAAQTGRLGRKTGPQPQVVATKGKVKWIEV